MWGIALLVFREVLEAALIVTVVAAATRGVRRRGWFIGGGIGVGVIGALLVAASAGVIAQAASGMGQEVFNAGVLLAAVLMIGWHVVWMSSHARELTRHMADVSSKVSAGASSLGVLLAVVALAVLREGSELVLLAAGLASNAARYLSQADLLPNWGDHVWDSSWLLTDDSFLGRILHILVGYDARPRSEER